MLKRSLQSLLILLTSAGGLVAQTTMIWTGAGTGSNWSTAANWNSGIPGATAIAQFSSNTAKDPNISGNTAVGELVFTGSTDAETFAGTKTLTLNGVSGLGIDNQTGLTHTFANKFALGASQTWQSTANGGGLTFSGTVNLAGFDLSLALASSGSSSTVTLGGAISGTGSSLTVVGYGLVNLTAAASYTGTTTINSGATLRTSGSGSLGTATDMTVNAGGTYDLNGINETISTIAGSGNILLGSATLTVRGAADTTFSGAISGGGGLTKNTGTGTLTLSGASSYGGITNINAGVIRIQNATALGSSTGVTVVTSGNALEIDGTAGGFTVSGESLSLAGTGISNGGALRNVGGDNLWTGALTLTGASRINSDAGSLTISGNIGGTQNLTVGGAGDTNISGIIGTGTGTLFKDGAGTVTISGANTFTGKTTISAGALSVSSLNRVSGGSANSNLGAPTTAANGTIALGATTNSGTLIYTGAGETTDRVISLAGTTGGGTLDASGTGALVFTSNFTSGAGAKTLTLAGTSAANVINTISGVIPNNSGTNITSVVKDGSNTWALTGANTYTGTTVVSGGILSASTIANGGTSSSIGAANNGASDLVLDGGTLKYTGAVTSSNRLFTLGTNGGTLDASGSGALAFTNTGSVAFTGTSARALTLTGTGTGSLAAAIGDNTGATSVVKNGSGTWTLSGANTYSGGLTLNQGTLNLNSNTAPGTGTLTIAGGTLDNTSGGTVILTNNNPQSWNGDFTFTGTNSLVMGTGAVTLGAGRQVTVSNNTLTIGGNISGAGLTFTKAGAGTLALTGASSTVGQVNLNAGSLSVGGSTTLNTGDFNSLAGATLTIASGGTVKANITGTATFSGTISAAGGTFEKDGAGTLAFNTTFDAGLGSTLVLSGGTLLLGANGVSITFDTIHITGNTTIDFGSSLTTTLTAANLIIDGAASVSVINWAYLGDRWYATSTFTQQGGPAAVHDVLNQQPQNQITFGGFPASWSTWVGVDGQIRPTPEPSTYGAIFLAGALALLGFRRWRTHR